jgi:ribosomal protein S18 acetylase RimI-like enzyme/nitroimidazol reductase NimA-like FMN-containing flavoprotein (pyridoxamine 5'-phosphate oxidase superfamily)
MANKDVVTGDAELTLEVFRRANVFQMATTTARGHPVLRAFHGVVVDGRLCFHTAPRGEKLEGIGRPVVVSAHRVVAEIPSYFVDPERACPATTYFRGASMRGTLVTVDDLDRKARALQALMERYQPEGGHVPITAADPRYAKMVRFLMIGAIEAHEHVVIEKLGQNRKPAQMADIVTGLWRRGAPGDLPAIETLLSAHPDAARPHILRGPRDSLLIAQPSGDDIDSAVALLRGQYWTDDIDDATLADAHRNSTAWVGARDPATGALVATARAVTDSARFAHVMDVAVTPALRGHGIGAAVVSLLLDHPAVRNAGVVRLGTRDAQSLYQRFGFASVGATYTEMVLRR